MVSTYTVLVVDDDPMARAMMRSNLSKMGLIVVEARDGEDAIQMFRKSLADLVLMDMKMPRMDGLHACKELRKLPHGQLVPIIVVTSLSDSDSAKQASAAGATDFITKPVNWRLLGERVQHLLNTHGRLAGDQTVVIEKKPVPAD